MYPNFKFLSISIFPLEALSSPHNMDNIVLLPQPLGPTIATNSPCFKFKEKSSNYILNKYNWDKIADKTLLVYRKCLND